MSAEDVFGNVCCKWVRRISKESPVKEVIKALNLFLLGRNYMSMEMEQLMKNEPIVSYSTQNPFDNLSDREVAVAHNLLRGIGVKKLPENLISNPPQWQLTKHASSTRLSEQSYGSPEHGANVSLLKLILLFIFI